MDKKYIGSSVIYGKKTFDFIIYYFVIFYSFLKNLRPLNVKEGAEGLVYRNKY